MGEIMAICVHLVPVSMNAGQYKKAVKLIADAGLGEPAGRLYHVCFGTGNDLQIIDIWKSQAEWDTFAQVVEKVSAEIGIEVGQIDIEPVQDIITP
ncbi:MAG: hypothetical protein J2P27_14275 [Actinobacteria bacterium]|nr:hypothetical protein [Actinomycetota bacterium]